jgi:hypothetical protein
MSNTCKKKNEENMDAHTYYEKMTVVAMAKENPFLVSSH